MTLLESIQSARANRESAFFAGLMQYAMQGQSSFDTSGDTPKYIPSTNPLPKKTELWNQYVQMKGGRLAPQDLAAFEQYYNSIASTIKGNDLAELGKLSNMGYDEKDIKKLVKDTPDLYNNLLDMVNDLSKATMSPGMSDQDRQAAVQASAIAQSYLPSPEDDSLLSKAAEFALENPIGTGIGTYTGLRLGEKYLSGKSKGIAKRLGLEDVSKKRTPKAKAKARRANFRKLSPRPGTAMLADFILPEFGETLAGQTGRQVGEVTSDAMLTAGGIRGLLGLTAQAPGLIPKAIGYGGLAGYGLLRMTGINDYLYDTFYGDDETAPTEQATK